MSDPTNMSDGVAEDAGEAWLRAGLQGGPDASDMEIDSTLRALGGAPLGERSRVGPQRPVTDSIAEAVRQLGGDSQEQRSAAGRLHRRISRREAVARAHEALPDPAQNRSREEEMRTWLASDYRYRAIERCGRLKEQARIVALLEDNLDGTETQLPEWISMAVLRIIEFDNRHPAEPDLGLSPKELYDRLAAEWHASQSES